jgi:mRNA interferase MazF
MTRYDTGDVLLLEFPFTSEAGLKRRPAVVILDAGDADVVVARITTQPYATGFDVAIRNWQGVGLLAPSVIRLHKLATIEKALVQRRLGRLQEPDRADFAQAFRKGYCRGEGE